MATEMPEDPREDATRTEMRIWEKCVDEYVKQQTVAKENLKSAYSLIWGQCLDLMCRLTTFMIYLVKVMPSFPEANQEHHLQLPESAMSTTCYP
jgi:hypothetical protein